MTKECTIYKGIWDNLSEIHSSYQKNGPSVLALWRFYSLLYLRLEISKFFHKGAGSDYLRL